MRGKKNNIKVRILALQCTSDCPPSLSMSESYGKDQMREFTVSELCVSQST